MTPLTDEQAAQDVILFKALANTVRLQIVSLVAASLEGQVSAGHIVEKFSLSQPTISHHLKILRDAGVLTAHKASTFVFYRFTPQLQDAVASLLPSRPVSAPPIQWVPTVRHRPAVSSAQAPSAMRVSTKFSDVGTIVHCSSPEQPAGNRDRRPG